jgi:hypothetical protein
MAMDGRGMVRTTIVLLCLLLAMPVAISDWGMSSAPTRGTEVPEGTIDSAVIWNAAGSPYDIMGNLTIGPTGVLTIEKGVAVRIGKGLMIDVHGKFVIKGTRSEQVTVTDAGNGAFNGINFTAGSYGRFEKLNLTGGKYGIDVSGAGATVHILNSTLKASGAGVASEDGAEVWSVNTTIAGSPRLSVFSGDVYECWWLFFSVVMDNGNPWKLGADLKATVNREFTSRNAYDSPFNSSIDPPTDANGKVRAIPIEEYYHDGMLNNYQNKLYLRMWATDPERSWSKNSGNINITGNLEYEWVLDTTPPPAPTNFTILARGGTYLVMSWEWDHNPNEHQLARFEVKYALTGETVFQTDTVNIKTQRQYNLSGLTTEKDYVVYIRALDIYGNAAQTAQIDVSTRDVSAPFPPYNVQINIVDRIDAVVTWDYSSSADVVGYQVFKNDTAGGKAFAGYADGKTTNSYTLENLTSETEYTFWVRAVDDGDPPNYSPFSMPGSNWTGDITPPTKPTIELYLVSPTQYIPGSPYYNRTYIGIRGAVAGENRTFIDIYVNDVQHIFSDAERPKTYQGLFTVYLFLQEGEHTIQACSIDPSGNKGELSDGILVVVDRTLPTIEFPRQWIETDAGADFDLVVNASDDSGIANITWKVTGGSEDLEYEGATVTTELPAGTFTAYCEVVDKAGNRNSSSITIVCWVPDLVPPSPKRTDPAENDASVEVDSKIMIEFEEDLKWNMVKGHLAKASAPLVQIAAHSRVDEANMSIIFTPAETLVAVTDYVFTLSEIYDLRGNHGDDVVIHFMTSDPTLVDLDEDGIPNFYEVLRPAFLDPSDPDDAQEDHDGDGLTNLEEYELGSDPAIKDTDDDGMEDGWEDKYGFNPTDKSDALSDADDDGFSNLDEFNDKTDPLDPKSHREKENTSFLGFIIAGVVVLIIIVIAAVIWTFMRRKEGIVAGSGPSDEQGTENKVETPPEQQGAACPGCGASITDDLDYCPECGEVIPRAEAGDLAESMMEEDVPGPGAPGEDAGSEDIDIQAQDDPDPMDEVR